MAWLSLVYFGTQPETGRELPQVKKYSSYGIFSCYKARLQEEKLRNNSFGVNGV
jgi:hypothetical protein